jgi:ribonuclease VapC
MVIDTSALLAVLFAEEHGRWAQERLDEHIGDLSMSTVNLAELLIRLRDRQPALFDTLEAEILASGIRFVPPDVEQARIAAAARLRLPLNLGDCFAYALAKVEACPILAVDADFRAVDAPLLLPDPTG